MAVATLKVLSGPEAGRSFDIDRELVIGRTDADLTIDDEELSRRHAAVRPLPGGIGIRDLGSTNGTLVNDRRITDEVVLDRPGTVELGSTKITIDPATAVGAPGPGEPVATSQATVQRPAAAAPPAGPPAQGAPGADRPVAPPPRYGGPSDGRPKAAKLLRKPWAAGLGLLLAIGAIVAIVAIASGGDDEKASDTRTAEGIVDIPIQFTVRDENRSLLPCKASGATYKVSGSLVAPASGPGSAVTLYLHGVILSGQFEWHFKEVPGYDFATEMAKLGHTSVLIDRVGYGKTRPIPRSGSPSCLGAQADHAHQMIGALRSGRYTLPGSSDLEPKPHRRVALAGYSLGGVITELEAGSFGDPDAVVVVSWADEGMTDYGTPFPVINRLCSPGSPKPPGGKNGYFRTLPLRKLPPLLSKQADPRVVAAMKREAELDPCGDLLTGGRWFQGTSRKARARIDAPVLMIHGIYDVLFHRSAWATSFRLFTGTRDKKRIGIPDGQLVMVDRHADDFRRKLSAWLKEHGF